MVKPYIYISKEKRKSDIAVYSHLSSEWKNLNFPCSKFKLKNIFGIIVFTLYKNFLNLTVCFVWKFCDLYFMYYFPLFGLLYFNFCVSFKTIYLSKHPANIKIQTVLNSSVVNTSNDRGVFICNLSNLS